MKRMIIVTLTLSELLVCADAGQLTRAVRVARELGVYLQISKNSKAPKNAAKVVVPKVIEQPKIISRPKSPAPAPKIIIETPSRIYDPTKIPSLRPLDQNLANEIRELLDAGIEPADIRQSLNMSVETFLDILKQFPPQPKVVSGVFRAQNNIEDIFYELRDDPNQWDIILKRYGIAEDVLMQMLAEYTALLADRMRELDQQAQQQNDYDQDSQRQNIAELFGLSVQEVQAILQKHFPEEYTQDPFNADESLEENEPKQMSKRDVQEQKPECIICGNDEFQGDLMYQTLCCGGKQFYCPTCLQGYEASLREDQQSSCSNCRTQPLHLRQFNINTGMYTQPEHEVKTNSAAAKEHQAKLQPIQQAKTNERRARLARGQYIGYRDFNDAYNQAMIAMQYVNNPAMIIEVEHDRAMRRRVQNPRFEAFVQDIINERFDGNMIEIGDNLLLLPTLSNFFDRYFNGRY
ncbi:hypothetical protein KAZ82_02420 [Candidatus Babeliales bacterium]|nr:hypothetical protein [Candidatus Babeliales bacterium]